MYIFFLLPVVLFILLLLFLDSFKLIKTKTLIISGLWGLVAALLALKVNVYLLEHLSLTGTAYSKYAAPIVEELLKMSIFIYLIKRGNVGFMIDGAIYGFASGAMFSIVENYWYFTHFSSDVNPMIWAVRGFGTALMHGGSTAIILMFAMGSMNTQHKLIPALLKGSVAAIIIHSLFNHIILVISPVLTTIIIVVSLPTTIILVFVRNEVLLKKWLDMELFQEVQLFKMMRSGKLGHTKTGEFIISLKSNFSSEIIMDMMNYISLYTELSLHAKKVMLLKETGIPVVREEHITDKLKELKALKHIIGKTGLLALSPILRMSQKDIWKLNMLEN